MTDNENPEAQWPTHRYVPGQNKRHPEHAFDSIKAGLSTDMSVAELAESSAFRHGLLYLENGYYWEAHEVFEPVWLSLPEHSDEKLFVQALIQVANAYLKHRMQRPRATRRLCEISALLLARLAASEILGVRKASILGMITDLEISPE